MNNMEMKVDALCKLILSETEEERTGARNALKALMQAPNTAPSTQKVSDVLFELSVPDHLLGHRYLKRAIELAIEDRVNIDNITTIMYWKIAKEFDTTPSRVERAIRHAIEVAWQRCDFGVTCKYFGSTVSFNKENPTNMHFIARIANVLR